MTTGSKFDWAALVEELLALAPGIVQAVYTDKQAASTETKTQLAGQALMQASTVAQQIDPNDTDKIEAATAVTGGIIAALQTTPPAPESQTPVPVTPAPPTAA